MARVLALAALVVLVALAAPTPAPGRSHGALVALVEQLVKGDKHNWVAHFNLTMGPTGDLAPVASHDMFDGEWLLEIVPEWQVTLDMAEAFVPRHVARPLLTIDAQLIIAVYLAMERFELLPRRPEPWYSSLWPWTQPVSLMHRFVDMMPAHVPLPTLYWSESDVREACAQFDQPPPRLHNLSNPALQAAYGSLLSREQFLWGYSMLVSRSFHSARGAMLVPVADLLNHDAVPNLQYRAIPQGRMFGFADRVAFVALRPIAAGEPLTISYGPRTNWELLLHYAFVLADNPHDEHLLTRAGRNQTLLGWRDGGSVALTLTWRGVRPAGAVRWMDALERGGATSLELARALATPANETAWGTAVARLCRARLRERPRLRHAALYALLRERDKMLRHCAAQR